MKVYIAGPMSGKEHYNFARFEAAAKVWRVSGHEVTTPFDANSIAWRKVHGRDFDPFNDKCEWGDPILPDMLAEDFAALCRAEAIALLPGWRHSKGARAETLIALNLGKPIYDAVTHRKLELTAHLFFEGDVA